MFAMPGLRAFSLAAERASGAVSCGVTGAFVGDVPLLQMVGTAGTKQWVVRALPELNEDLSAQYGLPIDVAAKAGALALIAAAFNRGDLAMAAIATVQMQFPDPPLLAKGRETEQEIAHRALELHRSRLLKFWDPEKHPRTGTPPNPGRFASESGESEPSPPATPIPTKPEAALIPAALVGPPWEKTPIVEGSGGGGVPRGTLELPFPRWPRSSSPEGSSPASSQPAGAPKAPQGARPTWSPPDPKSKLPFMSQSEPQLAPYVQGGKTSGIFRAPGMAPIELQSGEDGPALNMPLHSPGFTGYTRTHVEGHAAALMRLQGISEAWLEINNPKMCGACIENIETMLPPGAKLHIRFPNGTERTFPEDIKKLLKGGGTMKVKYFNYQDQLDPMDGAVIADNAQLDQLLDRARHGPPYVAKFAADNGCAIEIGIGKELGCAQYCCDGNPPYLMAVSPDPPMRRGYFEFLMADTPTPIAARYIIRFEELKKVALHFLQTGEQSDAVSWQPLDPRALTEDRERPADS